MTAKFVLTKLELVRAATYMQLNDQYDQVMFIQKSTNGVGITTWARFYNTGNSDRYQEIEVTDIESW
jgi:hypothetical protein